MRTEKCVKCGLEWGVVANLQVGKGGYLCPHCRDKKRKAAKKGDNPNKQHK